MDLIDRSKINFYHLTGPELRSAIEEAPTVPAVPLDKLCELLSSMDKMDCRICKTTVGICKAEDSMNICHSKERWKKILLKWMEEQDADRQ